MDEFTKGDRVSWDVGSDRYAGKVLTTTGRYIVVEADSGRYEKFTLRRDGEFRLLGYKFGTLTLGGEAYMDPSF